MIILVTGANGTLGRAIRKVFTPDKILILTDVFGDKNYVNYLDITKPELFSRFKNRSINLIIHCAAKTNLEECERLPDLAEEVNHIGTKNMVGLARELNIPIIYISTSGIFDGKQAIYIESDKPNPLSVYGRTKMLGEEEVRQYHQGYIFRTSWLMGGGRHDKKFLGKIYRILADSEHVIEAVDDIFGNPTYAQDFAGILQQAINEAWFPGIYHAVNEGKASRYDLADEFIRQLNYQLRTVVIPIKQRFCSYRPKCEVLQNSEKVKMRPWKEALKDYVKKEFLCS